MSIPQPSVEQYTLELDADETVHAVLDAGLRGEEAEALAAVLHAATDGPLVFAAAAEITAGAGAGPGTGAVVDAAAFVPVSASTVDGALAALAAGGLVVTRSVWQERPGQAYLSDGRIFTAVRVLRPFILLTRGHDGRWIRFPADPGRREEDLAAPCTTADTAPQPDPASAQAPAGARVGAVPAGWRVGPRARCARLAARSHAGRANTAPRRPPRGPVGRAVPATPAGQQTPPPPEPPCLGCWAARP